MSPPWKNGLPKAKVLDFAMTVLSRSKNAAARVTRHDCKCTGLRKRRSRAVHTRTGHPQIAAVPVSSCPVRVVWGGASNRLLRRSRPPSARRQRRRRPRRRPAAAGRGGRRGGRPRHRRGPPPPPPPPPPPRAPPRGG